MRITGLLIKQLGRSEYDRQYNRMRVKTDRTYWTGLSVVKLGRAEYMKLWKQKTKEKLCH